jgi:hypothetical protein
MKSKCETRGLRQRSMMVGCNVILLINLPEVITFHARRITIYARARGKID